MAGPVTSNAVTPVNNPAPPQSAFDARIVELEIVLPGQTLSFSGEPGGQNFAIAASGQKFFSTSASSCQARIYNLTPQQRQQIITLSSPVKIPRTRVFMNLRVGRRSYGTFLLYSGQVVLADVLQPPDIGIVLNGLANNFLSGLVKATQYPENTPLSTIAQGVADSGDWNLNNQCTDKMINNFSFTGTPLDGVEELNQMGNVQACVDNGTLIVTDANKAVTGTPYLLNISTGMVGIPQVTDQGVIVRMMISNLVQIGGSVTIQSITNPAANGTYKIMNIHFDVSSRDTPFYYTLFCSNLGLNNGTQG